MFSSVCNIPRWPCLSWSYINSNLFRIWFIFYVVSVARFFYGMMKGINDKHSMMCHSIVSHIQKHLFHDLLINRWFLRFPFQCFVKLYFFSLLYEMWRLFKRKIDLNVIQFIRLTHLAKYLTEKWDTRVVVLVRLAFARYENIYL